MSVSHFPASPSFTGFNTPSRIEADIADLAHEGEIPAELNGAFYRVQPDPQFPRAWATILRSTAMA
jgi:carotenoid cleavage dioxygenase